MPAFLDSTHLLDDTIELRARMERDGYLYLRGILPLDLVDRARHAIVEVARGGGWVRADAPPGDPIADPDGFAVEPEPDHAKEGYRDVYREIFRLQDLHRVAHHPGLHDLVERLVGEPVIRHPRLYGRFIFPNQEKFATPAHQDFVPIQGTRATYTAWTPLSDIPAEMGGLEIAPGTHAQGVYDIEIAQGASGMGISDPLDGKWVNSPVDQGDVLLFHSMTVHRGKPTFGKRLRMSVDTRFQPKSEPVAEASLLPRTMWENWDQVYEHWEPSDLQYYWRDWDTTIKDVDSTWIDRRDREAIALGEAGDPRARSALQRIVTYDKDPAKRERAERLLDNLSDQAGSRTSG